VTDLGVLGKLDQGSKMSSNKQASPDVRFDGQTVIVTGAGAGLGRTYALMYGRLGANVVINDINEKGANAVVDEVVKAGGKAVAAVCPVEDADKIVKIALDKFGSVHVLVSNAGIVREKSFASMTEQEWDIVLAAHLRGTYKCAKALWPIFQKQKYGRIVTTSSQSGIYGGVGEANYSTAKAGIIGLTRTLAIEGKKYNIFANCIAPFAGPAMTSTSRPQTMEAYKPDHIAPVVGYLSSKGNETATGGLFEVTGGWAGQARWQRAGGHCFPNDKPYTPEDVRAKWNIITNFNDGRAIHPSSTSEALQQLTENFENKAGEHKAKL